MHKIKLVIFDMDGLLVDSESHYSDGWKYAIKKEGYDIEQDVVNSWVGQGIKKTINYLTELTKNPETVKKIVYNREMYIYEQLNRGKIKEMPFATELLRNLYNEGCKIGIASSTHRKRAEAILDNLGLLKFVDFSCYGDEVREVKPHPAIYQKVLSDSKYSRDEAIAVEDSYAGSKSAGLAGLDTVVIPYVNFEIEKIKELENVIEIQKDLRSVLKYL